MAPWVQVFNTFSPPDPPPPSIVKERNLNGKFVSINDFINRVNPKDINKLQLEGLVKAGAFDKLNSNRQALFETIPGIIAKSKNIYQQHYVIIDKSICI